MSDKHPVLVVDTNIWIDCYLVNRPQHHAAQGLIDFAAEKGCTIAYAATAIKDVFYLLEQEFKKMIRAEKGALSESDALACRKIAWGCIRNMADVAVASPVGEPQVWLASHYEDFHSDFEDDLVLAALETSKAEFFVTGDKALREKAPVGAFDAADMLAYLKAREG